MADRRLLSPDLTGEPLRVSWLSVAMLTTLLAYVDGFCVTSLHGAVGTVQSSQQPVLRWLRDSTMMLAPMCLAVLTAMFVARRWLGETRRESFRFAAAALLIVVVSSAISIAEVATNAVADYRAQVHEIGALDHSGHFIAPVAATVSGGTCTATCAARHLTVAADIRAVRDSAVVLVVTNVVLVLWVLALRGGRLWERGQRTFQPRSTSEGPRLAAAPRE